MRVIVNAPQQKHVPQVLLCVVLSVLLHVLLGLLLVLAPPPERLKPQKKQLHQARQVRVLRTATRKKADMQKKHPAAPREKEQKSAQKPFAKTSAETRQRRPEQPEYEGKRDTRAASATNAPHRRSDAAAPAQEGEEKEELVTFDQERQEGDLEHEGLRRKQQQPPAPPRPVAAEEESTAPPLPPAAAAAARGRPDSSTQNTEGADTATTQVDTTRALTMTDDLSGLLKLQPDATTRQPSETEQQAAPQELPGAQGRNAETPASRAGAAPRRPRVFFDPSLAEWAQKPGFRTYERRSRSTGRFVLGRGAALNVAATARGQYEALVYRRIAHFWYIACDEHRGDIIPGKITISLRINKRGHIDSMALIRRRGASISQQSFTFKAIRQASLPPMPAEVQADVIGELMELIFEFNFD